MDLMFALATVDMMQGNRQARQLLDGWAVRQPRSGRYRAVLARALFALASRLDPAATHPRRAVPSPTV